MNDDSEKIRPADVLAMRAGGAAALTRTLGEVDRYVLVRELIKLARQHSLSEPQAEVFAAVFSELGPARLKLVAWSQLTSSGGETLSPSSIVLRRIVLRRIVPMIVTGVFGITVGEAGVGMKPSYKSDEDRADMETMNRPTRNDQLVDHRVRYEALATAAQEAGTLRILVGGSV